VDLHIEKLLPDWKGLSNFEILQIQLSHLEKMMERSIRNQQPSMIVIHGIGEGKLKGEIHQYLRQIKEVHSFENRYDPRFGQGATTIQFQY
jgi:dsDNA-specific endonuclease/ATPase MutS2